MPPGDWSPTPTEPKPEHVHDGSDLDCEDCARTQRVADAGAKALCDGAGIDWDTLDAHQRGHYALIAADVMGAMSEALLAEQILVEKEPSHG